MMKVEYNFEGKKVLPPYTNRGVEDTEREGLTSSIDWFSCTFLVETEPINVIAIIGLNPYDFFQTKTGARGYKRGMIYEGIKVLYDGADNMGVHIEMSGSACRMFEKYSELTWQDLFLRFKHHYVAKCNITRIDIAVDDFKGYFKIPTLINYLKRGDVTSKFKMAQGISNFIIKTGEEIGHTLYFGRPTSDIQVRFYEKNIEQQMKGNIVPDDAQIWNRTEIQARDDRAWMIVDMLADSIDGLGVIVTGILKSYVNFRRKNIRNGKPTTDANKARWDIAVFWDKFLGDVEPLKLTLKPVEVTIEKKYEWVETNVSKSLSMLTLAFPEDTETLINNFIAEGFGRLEQADWDVVNGFIDKKINLEQYLDKIKEVQSPEKDE